MVGTNALDWHGTSVFIELASWIQMGGDMRRIRIANRFVGENDPCLIIVDAGVNHNNDPARAIALVEKAAEAGADVIKFQTYKADTITMRLFEGTDSKTTFDYAVAPWTRDTTQDIYHYETLFNFMGRNTKAYLDKDSTMLH
jgi:NeuB family